MHFVDMTSPNCGRRRSAYPLAVAVLIALVAIGCESSTDPQASPSGGAVPAGMTAARVTRVVDGDTIIVEIDGREERLRYIGIDTPESVDPSAPIECFGKEASAENERLVGDGQVYLEKDVSERDRYGRLLRYVYVAGSGTERLLFVNLALVESGYAQVSTFPPDVRHDTEFRAAQREAREAGRGLWGAC